MMTAAKDKAPLPNGVAVVERADGDGPGDGVRKAQRDRLLEAVLGAKVAFWQDADGTAYATVPASGDTGQQRYRIRSRRFALVVRDLYGQANQRQVGGMGLVIPGSISDTALAETLPALEAIALRGPVWEPDVRACHWQGAVWLDLGGPDWRLVRVDAAGWRVVPGADVPLLRPDGMRALPVPVVVAPGKRQATLATLRGLLNIGTDEADGQDKDGKPHQPRERAFKLVVAWLVAALHPTGPYPVLALDGEQGSGKSTCCRMLRRLVDPSKADLRAPPRHEDDLIVAATAARVLALDNVSFIEAETADALCRLATGAGLSKRKLYSDGDEHLVSVCRPILLNGIPSLLARGDLADRAVAITLPTIPDAQRKPEAEVWRDFEAAAPVILALLLDGLARALADMPTLRLDRLPRMADFARLACAAAPAFGWTQADMLDAIEGNRADAVEAVIEADPVAVAVRGFMEGQHGRTWEGTASALLEIVNGLTPTEQQRERAYPKDAGRLSTRLRRIAPAMRRDGWDIALPESGGRRGRSITIKPLQAGAQQRAAVPDDFGAEGSAGGFV